MNLSNKKTLLPRMQWSSSVYDRLCEVISSYARRSKQEERSIAVFDLDNTCILNDLGELFSHYLIENLLYRYDLDCFWELIDAQDGRDHLFQLTQHVVNLPNDGLKDHPLYRQYLCDMGALYNNRLERLGKASCYEWAVRLHVGMHEQEVRDYARRAIEFELQSTLTREVRENARGGATSISRGIRIFDEIHTLMQVLRHVGIDVWLVSASNQWAVETMGRLFGVKPENVIGNQVHVDSEGVLTATTRQPVLFGPGKVEAIEKVIGTLPILAFGDAETDLEMLCSARELAIFIDSGNARMREASQALGWAVQPQSQLTAVQDPTRWISTPLS